MCLILKATSLPESFSDEITAYKVYRIWREKLFSPHMAYIKNGVIDSPGTYEANLRSSLLTDAILSGTLSIFIGKNVDISGFHCFVKKEDAAAYAITLAKNDLDVSIFIIIPVQLKKSDVIAFGQTPFYTPVRKELDTIVTKSITISKEDFNKAIPCV